LIQENLEIHSICKSVLSTILGLGIFKSNNKRLEN